MHLDEVDLSKHVANIYRLVNQIPLNGQTKTEDVNFSSIRLSLMAK